MSRIAPLDCTALSDANYTHSDAASQAAAGGSCGAAYPIMNRTAKTSAAFDTMLASVMVSR